MMRILVWEFRKIVEHKWLWGIIGICVLYALLYRGESPSDYYEYGKRVNEQELYQYSMKVEDKYPGALNQYGDEISKEYQQLRKTYDTLISNCDTELRFCNSDAYLKFMNGDAIYYLIIYEKLDFAIKISEHRNMSEGTQYELAKESLAYSVGESPSLKDKFISLKLERISELQKQESSVYINHGYILEQYIDGVIYYSFLILIVLGLGLTPVFAEDHDYQTNYLIGSSKTGRRLIFNKILAALLFGVLVFIIFFSIHFIRFVLNNRMHRVLNHPIFTVNNSDLIPWRDMTFVEFIVNYWGYIFLLMILSVLIILLISRVTKKVLLGIIVSMFYFSYPFIIENILKVNLRFGYRYLINYLNISKVYAHSERLLFLGDPYEVSVYDYRFWGRDVVLLNTLLVIIVMGYLNYRYVRRIDLS